MFGLTACGSSDDSSNTQASAGGLKPPAWIQGTWAGGSPILLHLTFSANSILDGDGEEALPGYTETGSTDTEYLLERDNETSFFQKTSATKLKWLVDNGTISDVIVMTKQ